MNKKSLLVVPFAYGLVGLITIFSPQPAPAVTAVKPSASPMPAPIEHKLPNSAPTGTPAVYNPRVTPKPTTPPLPPLTPGVYTPAPTSSPVATTYDPQCYTHCYADLTQDQIAKVQAYYQGSFEDGTGAFKGLPDDLQFDHFACEWAQVVEDDIAIQACRK